MARQDMRWIPLWVRVDLFARAILLLVVIHTDSSRLTAVVCNVLALLIHLGVLWCNNIMRPCCVFWVNWMKMVIHSCACWSTIVAICIISFDIRSVTFVMITNVCGWGTLLLYFKVNQQQFILVSPARHLPLPSGRDCEQAVHCPSLPPHPRRKGGERARCTEHKGGENSGLTNNPRYQGQIAARPSI